MICRNCKFSLHGNERYCPNCGAPLCEEEATSQSSPLTPPEAPGIFFTPVSAPDNGTPDIFRAEKGTEEEKNDTVPKKKGSKSSSKAPVVLMLILVIAVLTVGLFVAAEKLKVVPALRSYLNTAAGTPTDAAATGLLYSPDERPSPSPEGGTVKPDINYSATEGYVARINLLSLRKGPSDAYGLIKSLESGCLLNITGGTALTDSWIYVYVPSEDCFGWVNAAFVSLYTYTEATEGIKSHDYIPSHSQEGVM